MAYVVARLTCKDNEFAYHVDARKVDAWVRLREALFLSLPYSFREGDVPAYGVEDEVKRAAEHCLYLGYAVARFHKVVNGVYNGQASANVGLEVILHVVLNSRFLQSAIQVDVA